MKILAAALSIVLIAAYAAWMPRYELVAAVNWFNSIGMHEHVWFDGEKYYIERVYARCPHGEGFVWLGSHRE